MYVVVTYDCRDERVRKKIRSILRRHSFTMLTYSVYIGKGSRGLAERISSFISRVLSEGDRATVMLLNDFQYELLMEVTKESVSIKGESQQVIVFFGRGESRYGVASSSNEDSRRSQHLRTESSTQSRAPSQQSADSNAGARQNLVEKEG